MNYRKIYSDLVNKRKIDIPTGYTETHHILPRCLGGDNSKDNLVKLTAREHFIAHLLLTKCYDEGTLEYYKMVHAFFMMLNAKNNKQERLITSKKYEQLKTQYSVLMSVNQTGERNSGYGKVWIHNPTTHECKKVLPDQVLPEGWHKGRVMNWTNYGSVKVHRPCKKCGSSVCDRPEVCKKLLTNTFIKYFNFDSSSIGTPMYYTEFDRVVEHISNLYHVEKMSVQKITEMYGFSSNERVRMMLKSLGIDRRSFKEAQEVYKAVV